MYFSTAEGLQKDSRKILKRISNTILEKNAMEKSENDQKTNNSIKYQHRKPFTIGLNRGISCKPLFKRCLIDNVHN